MYRFKLALAFILPLLTYLQGCADGAEESSKPVLPKTIITPSNIIHNNDIDLQIACPTNNCAEIRFSINNNEEQPYIGSFPLNSAQYANQIISVHYYAIANNGSIEKEKSQEYVIDNLPPINNGVDISGNSYTTSQRVKIKCSDSQAQSPNINSGCATFRYKFTPNGQAESNDFLSVPYNQPVSIQQDGTLKYFAEDKAGNTSDVLTENYQFSNQLGNITNLTSVVDSQSITLNWQNPTDATFDHVSIHRSDDAQNASGTEVYSGTATTYVDTDVQSGTIYYYRIYATNADGTEISSGIDITASLPSVAVVSLEVTDLTITPKDKSVLLSWSNPTSSDFQKVVIQHSAESAPLTIEDGDNVYTGIGSQYLDQKLQNGTQHFYTVFTVNTLGIVSNGVSVDAVANDSEPPSLVTELKISIQQNALQLNWKNPNNVDFAGVQLVRSEIATPANETDGTILLTGNELTFTDSNLTNGTTYYYAIFSFDTNGNYSLGAAISGAPEGDTTPPTVMNTDPLANTIYVSPLINSISATFSEEIQAESVVGSIQLTSTGTAITGSTSRDASDFSITHFSIANGPLALATQYTATVLNQVKDLNGLSMTENYSWDFTTDDGTWKPQAIIAENFDTGSGYNDTPSAIGFDGSDNGLVIWAQSVATGADPTDVNAGGRLTSIYANTYTAKGGWDNTKAVRISTPDTSTDDPQLAVTDNGTAIAIWVQADVGGDVVFAARYSPSGGWESPNKIQSTPIASSLPKLAISGNGTVVIAWRQDNGTDGKDDIWATHFSITDDLSTVPLANNTLLETRTGDATGVDVAADANGNAMVLWNNHAYDANSVLVDEVLFNQLTLDANNNYNWLASEGGPINTTVGTDVYVYYTNIAMAADGSAYAVWKQNMPRASRYTAANGWEPDLLLADPTIIYQNNNPIALETYKNGDAIAIWDHDGTTYLAKYVVGSGWQERLVGPAGDQVSRAFPLSTSSGDDIVIGIDNSNNALIFMDTSSDMEATRYLSGTPLEDLIKQPTVLVDDDSSRSYNYFPAVAVDSKGRGLATWAKHATNGYGNDLKLNVFNYIPPSPDLTVTIDNISVTDLGDMTIDYTIKNTNNIAADAFEVNFFLNPAEAPVLGSTGSELAAPFKIGIGPNTSVSATVTTVIDPNTLVQGSAYAIVDNANVIAEDNDGNNVSNKYNWAVVSMTLDLDFENGIPAEVVPAAPLDVAGTAPLIWSIVTSENGPSVAGVASFQSVNTDPSTESCFSITPTQTTSSVSFDLMVSSESGYDKLKFYVIGEGNTDPRGDLIQDWSGLIAWQKWSTSSLPTPINLGNNTYIWCYQKDGGGVGGDDIVWVDNIHIQ